MKLMRSGRHATPSQVEKVAEKAGKAAPAMAVTAGALMAVPHGHTTAAATHGTVAAAVATAKTEHATVAGAGSAAQAVIMTKAALAHSTRLDAATHAAKASQNYAVRPGDTLSSISARVYGKSGDWQWLYHVNSKTIPDPDLIYPGQVLNVPADPPANYTLPASAIPATTSSGSNAPAGGYKARHAAPATQSSDSGSGSGTVSAPTTISHVSGGATPTSAGTYSCGGLESLWEEAGGSSGEAVMAAEIAMAESGGNPNAISPTNDFGLWQINGSHGAQATLDPLGNARAAVDISGDGSDWNPWTTYVTGAYAGRC
jgi:LysM repeat protein